MKNTEEVIAFGKKLQKLRKDAKLSQQELSWEADVGLRTVQRIEAGESVAGIDVVFSLAKALKLSPCAFFDDINSIDQK